MTENIDTTGFNNTTEYENGSFPSHILPAAIITAVFLALILIIVTILKLCSYARRRTTRGPSRIFNKSDSEQDFQKNHTDSELQVSTDKLFKSGHENSQVDPEEDTSVQELQEGDDNTGELEFIKCARSAYDKPSWSSRSSCDDQREMGASSNDYIVYNPDCVVRCMTVEVEMHPKELQRCCESSSHLAVSHV